MKRLGFRIQGSGFSVRGSGFRVQGSSLEQSTCIPLHTTGQAPATSRGSGGKDGILQDDLSVWNSW